MGKKLQILVLAALLLPMVLFAQTLTVADGTETNSKVPVNGFWVDSYCRCQTIYPASMIASTSVMVGGSITGLTYYLCDSASGLWGNAQFVVNIKEVSNSTLSSFVDMIGATTVYTGALDGTHSTMNITFTTPYTYQGGNLVVEIYNTEVGDYEASSFYGVSASQASMQGHNSSGWDNISGSAEDFIPKTTFTFTGGSTIPSDWHFQFSFNATTGGQYGVATDGQYIYTSDWRSEPDSGYSFSKYNLYGQFIEGFNIPGVSEIRDLTYDGTYFYGGANGSELYQIDMANKTLVSTINTSVSAIRHCSYDPVNDGFWVGGWSDLQLVNRAGQTMSVENGSFESIAGSVYDPYSEGGPYLWLFCQPNSNNVFYKYDIVHHTMVGGSLDLRALQPDIPEQSISGGASGTTSLPGSPGRFVILTSSQTTPNQINLFDIANTGVSCEDHTQDNSISVFPNPASSTLNVHAENYDNVQILNSLGQVVYSNKVTDNDFRINISGFSKGLYFLRLDGKTTATRKFIKE